jgi:hypothetical protein
MKLSISIICFLSFCLVILFVQKQVQGAKELTDAQSLVNIKKLKSLLEDVLMVGKNDNNPSRLVANRIHDVMFYPDRPDARIPMVFDIIKGASTKLKGVDLTYLKPSAFNDLLESINKLAPVLKWLDEDPNAKELAGEVREIIKIYKEVENNRKSNVASNQGSKEKQASESYINSYTVGTFAAGLVIGLCIGGFFIGPTLYTKEPSSGAHVGKKSPKGTKMGARKRTKKGEPGK